MNILSWWSAGVTSAVASKLAIERFGRENVRLIYFHIDTAHSDNIRFKRECEDWYGKEIEVYKSDKYTDQFDVIESTGYINGAYGARCTLELKKEVRRKIERECEYDYQVFGFEYSKKEVNRAIRFREQYPDAKGIFPLILSKMNKPEALHYLESAGIRKPVMYELGYPNNNCIGCVKGGMGYWNKIRKDFPWAFQRMSELERETGHSCLRNSDDSLLFLDELDENRGQRQKIIMPDCGNFCDIEFKELLHSQLESIMAQPLLLEKI